MRDKGINQIFTTAKIKMRPTTQAWQRLRATHLHPPSFLAFSGRTPELSGLMAGQPDV